MRSSLIVISTILVLVSPMVYIHSIIRGETRPHRTTQFVLLVITAISTWSLIDSDFNAAFWLALASFAQTIAIFLISIKRGYGGWARLDIACLIIAMIGVIIWQITGQPLVGLLASIIADFVGVIPTLVKTHRHPHTENWQFYFMDTIAGTCSLVALTDYSFYSVSYPVYIVLINAVTVYLIFDRTNKRKVNA